tara:strand:- start:10602 stop:11507 length:906 start_codon:yes stop_codon:yes gene_type:complete
MSFTLPIDAVTDLKVHPVADLFPMLPADEAAELSLDVGMYGLREAITLYDGELLDGRNRLKACRDAGVEPVFETYDGDDPVGFIISKNIRRRQLSPSQRAMIAAEIARLAPGRPKKASAAEPVSDPLFEEVPDRDGGSMTENSAHGQSFAENGAHGPGFASVDAAARQMDVGVRTIGRAKAVREQGCPALVKAVEDGGVSLRAAERIVRSLSRDEQDALAAQGADAMMERAARLAQAATKIATPKAGEVLAAMVRDALLPSCDTFEIPIDQVNACRGQSPDIHVDHAAGVVQVTLARGSAS